MYIPQKDPMGCGVACVANKLNISYDDALHLFEYPEHAQTTGYKCKYIVDALNRAGQNVRLRHIKEINRELVMSGAISVPNGAIVLLEKSDLYPYQHYLLKAKDGWIDPWINMHDDADVLQARVDVRKQLPGKPYYAII